ncbi:hypothetical protein VPH35_061279 [Triticum aestivum]|uniref:uncharacterized protein n=1 Tax=Triticum aestivum TaxID=4565 RepID=UPI000844F3C1|nr:uncharacterized protein LOC123074897 [Triticum aestivum]
MLHSRRNLYRSSRSAYESFPMARNIAVHGQMNGASRLGPATSLMAMHFSAPPVILWANKLASSKGRMEQKRVGKPRSSTCHQPSSLQIVAIAMGLYTRTRVSTYFASNTVVRGSLIEMTGPKRGITMTSPVLVEYDMRIKKGEQEEYDLQLIDGATDFCEVTTPSHPFTSRINGDCGAVDITLAHVVNAVEATIDVIVSEVRSGFNLSLSLYVFVGGSYQGIELLCDIIGESCVITRRYVIAVEMDSWMHLKLKVGQEGSKYGERHCRFKANLHEFAR